MMDDAAIAPLNSHPGYEAHPALRWFCYSKATHSTRSVETRIEAYQGDDLFAFVISANIERRGFDESQPAMCTTIAQRRAACILAEGRRYA
jgi:hypothetical protein